MKEQTLTISTIKELQKNIYLMKLDGDCSEIDAPGQFINIKLDGFFLRRPISIEDHSDNDLTIIFKVVGRGTESLAALPPGSKIDVLMPLGNGFDLSAFSSAQKNCLPPVLIGGGIGLPPVYGLAKQLKSNGITPVVIAGFNSASEVILENDFEKIGITPLITTVDGSYGRKGLVTDPLAEILAPAPDSYVFTCGPEPMLKAVHASVKDGQFSFEARMACGFGACMGCSCRTRYGYKRICTEGPVLYKEEIVW